MDEKDVLDYALYERYGAVKRARGPFLYTQKSVRLVDLYQEDGRAILGWGGCSAYTMLKNTLSRGLTVSFKTDYFARLEKAVCQLLDSPRRIALFNSKEEALRQALEIDREGVSVWMPWDPASVSWKSTPCIVIEPPLAWCSCPVILAVSEDAVPKDYGCRSLVVAPPLLAAMTRSLYDVHSAVKVRKEKDWFLYDTVLNRYFTRKGPYLYPTVPAERYRDFVMHCLDNGIVINPYYNHKSIVPFGADKGVFSSLKKNPFLF